MTACATAVRRWIVLLLVPLALLAFTAQGSTQEGADARLDAAAATLDQIDAALQRDSLDTSTLTNLRDQTEGLRDVITDVIAKAQPVLQASDQRLQQLGAPPAAGAAPEAAETAQARADEAKRRQPAEDTVKRARLLQVRADQAAERIATVEREQFAGRIMQYSRSVLAPSLWIDVAQHLPNQFSALRILLGDWGGLVAQRIDAARAVVLAIALIAAFIVAWPLRRRLHRLGRAFMVEQVPASRLRRSANAVLTVLILTVCPSVAALLVYLGLSFTDLMAPSTDVFLRGVVWSIVFVFLVKGLSRGLLSPNRPGWRLLSLSDAAVQRVRHYPTTIAVVVMVGAMLAALNGSLGADLSVVIVTDAVAAIAIAITFGLALRAARDAQDEEDRADDGGNPSEAGRSVFGLALVALWIAIVVVLLAAVAGYVAFALFLAHQMVWLSLLAAVIYLLLAVIDDVFTFGFAQTSALGRFARHTVGLRSRSIEQIGIVLSGILRIGLIIAGVMLAVAPWGIGTGDVRLWIRNAGSGFSIGGLTLAPGAIASALVVIAIGVVATRAVQRWLESSFLPHTQLDSGLRNSIRTGFGYAGLIVTAALTLSTLGLGLDRLAIVAGALSVGIGFGLQSIVNNFVSGLILLAERPIRVGDLVMVGTDQGEVRKISVRSTEIELFDRSTLIVPNSELITQKVKNLTHNNPIGRIQIDASVGYGSDPEEARKILLECAKEHPLVLKRPEPSVNISSFGEFGVAMSLFCFVESPRKVAGPKTEIQVAILKRFRLQGVELPYPQHAFRLDNPDQPPPNPPANDTDPPDGPSP